MFFVFYSVAFYILVEVVPDIFHSHLVLCIEIVISSQNG